MLISMRAHVEIFYARFQPLIQAMISADSLMSNNTEIHGEFRAIMRYDSLRVDFGLSPSVEVDTVD